MFYRLLTSMVNGLILDLVLVMTVKNANNDSVLSAIKNNIVPYTTIL